MKINFKKLASEFGETLMQTSTHRQHKRLQQLDDKSNKLESRRMQRRSKQALRYS
jgi:hypothetical protein